MATMGGETSPLVEVGFFFKVVVDGLPTLGDFLEIEPLTYRFEPFKAPEGGFNHSPYALFGQPEWGRIVLRWGLMDRTAFWDWIALVKVGSVFRKNGAIYQYPRTEGGAPLRTYSFTGAWPVEWSGPGLSALNSEIPVETLTLAVQHVSITVTPTAKV